MSFLLSAVSVFHICLVKVPASRGEKPMGKPCEGAHLSPVKKTGPGIAERTMNRGCREVGVGKTRAGRQAGRRVEDLHQGLISVTWVEQLEEQPTLRSQGLVWYARKAWSTALRLHWDECLMSGAWKRSHEEKVKLQSWECIGAAKSSGWSFPHHELVTASGASALVAHLSEIQSISFASPYVSELLLPASAPSVCLSVTKTHTFPPT